MPSSRRDFLATGAAALATLFCLPAFVDGHFVAQAPRVRDGLGHRPRILVVGIGGAGVRMLDRVHGARLPDIECIAIDADRQALDAGHADAQVLVGPKATGGLGCWGRLQRGQRAIAESHADVIGAMGEADLVLVLAGMGGGLGTVAAPFAAQLARDAGALTVAVVTRPFGAEGPWRNRRARAGLHELAARSDSIVVIPNDRMIDIVGGHARLSDIFEQLDEAAAAAARAITSMVTFRGRICVDFADIREVFHGRGYGSVGYGEATGADRAGRAVRSALASPLLRDADLRNAGGVLLQFAARDPSLAEIQQASKVVYDAVGDETSVIVGDVVACVKGDGMRVTLIAAGSIEPGREPWDAVVK